MLKQCPSWQLPLDNSAGRDCYKKLPLEMKKKQYLEETTLPAKLSRSYFAS
jgi:hypothetical protein